MHDKMFKLMKTKIFSILLLGKVILASMGKNFQSNFVTKATRVHIVLHFMIRVEISSKSTYLCMALSYGTCL